MRLRRVVAAVGVIGAAALLTLPSAPALVSAAGGVPQFAVDPAWPPKLPNGWVFGDASSIAVDRSDHVFVLSRPRTVAAENKDHAAPPVVEFDAQGKFVRGWGGPASGYDWPDTEHGIYIDYKDNVWIGGNNPIAQLRLTPRSDDMLLKFSKSGAFVKQFGGRDKSGGNKDSANPKEPADVFVYQKTNEAFVADGYGNRRVWVIDADSGAFKRMWGAFSNTPLDPPPPAPAPPAGSAPAARPTLETTGRGPEQFGIVHSVKVSNDGLVYIADRGNRRVQVFTLDGKYIDQVFINRGGPSANSAAGVGLSPDKDQEFMYVADFGNGHVVIVRRKTLEVVGSFGDQGAQPGQFQNIHHLAVDSKGNIYTAEVAPGRRFQRFVFKGKS
jgi:DNA-binding beta-propeller fold protein YncE